MLLTQYFACCSLALFNKSDSCNPGFGAIVCHLKADLAMKIRWHFEWILQGMKLHNLCAGTGVWSPVPSVCSIPVVTGASGGGLDVIQGENPFKVLFLEEAEYHAPGRQLASAMYIIWSG